MGEETRPNPSRAIIARWVAVGLIVSAIGIVLGIAIDWFPVQGSTQADQIDTLWDVLIVASVPFFVLVTGVVLFCVTYFRQRPGEELLDGPSIHGSTRLEVIWTALPAALILALVAYAYVVLVDIEKAPANAAQELKVDVYGEQFAWTFKYKAPNGKQVNTTRLYLPVNKSVKFNVHSKDVLHDFWIPAMRMKIDAVPGVDTSYRITPIRNGTYPVVCAELCGLGHAFMRYTVYVVPQPKFDAWLAKQTAPAPAAADGTPAAIDAKDALQQGQHELHRRAAAATSWPTPASPEASGRTSTRRSRARTRPSSRSRSSIPRPRSPRASPPASCRRTTPRRSSPAELDALVKYLVKVTNK